MAIRYEINNTYIASKDNGAIISKLKKYVSPECNLPKNTLVAFRTLCNFFIHPSGEELIFSNRLSLIENITGLISGNKNIEVSQIYDCDILVNSLIFYSK